MIGGGVPVYQGYSSQYGYGLGNVLGGIIRAAVPMITPIAKDVGRKLLKAGMRKLRKPTKRKRKAANNPPRKRRRRDIFK